MLWLIYEGILQGAVLSVETMRIMSYLGMELFLSEYPDGDGE